MPSRPIWQNSQRTFLTLSIMLFSRFPLVDNSLSLSFCKPLQFLFKLSLIGFSSRDYTMFPLFSCAVWWINPCREVLNHIKCSFSSHWLLIVHFAGCFGWFVCLCYFSPLHPLWQCCDNPVMMAASQTVVKDSMHGTRKVTKKSNSHIFYFIYTPQFSFPFFSPLSVVMLMDRLLLLFPLLFYQYKYASFSREFMLHHRHWCFGNASMWLRLKHVCKISTCVKSALV